MSEIGSIFGFISDGLFLEASNNFIDGCFSKQRKSNPFDHDGSICFSKRLSHANVRTVPRMDQSVNGSEKQL
jgi:hypothetical protein